MGEASVIPLLLILVNKFSFGIILVGVIKTAWFAFRQKEYILRTSNTLEVVCYGK